MKRHVVYRLGLILLTSISILIGCSRSQPSRFYILNPLPYPPEEQVLEPVTQQISVYVSRIIVPDYLDRPQIVRRASDNRIRLAEFERWAEPLDKNIKRVIVENLSTLLNKKNVILNNDPALSDFVLNIEIIRFDTTDDWNAFLVAKWSLLPNNHIKEMISRMEQYSAKVDSRTYEALVASQSALLTELCKDIAAIIPEQ